jgi:hypothetical protein
MQCIGIMDTGHLRPKPEPLSDDEDDSDGGTLSITPTTGHSSVHAACFDLLTKCIGGEEPGLELRLHDICASIPVSAQGFPCIDHDYGGYWKLDESCYPWQNKATLVRISDAASEDNDDDDDDGCWFQNPLIAPALHYFVDETAKASAQEFLAKSVRTTNAPKQSTSAMLRLPLEVKEMIAINLCTRDAMALRLASSEFLPLLHSRHFWLSRFHGSGQMSFFFEARHLKTVAGLIIANKSLPRVNRTGVLANRQRVWSLASRWKDLIKLELTSPMNILPIAACVEYEWFSVSGKIGPEGHALTLPDGCKTLFGGRTAVRQQPLQVTVFLCTPGSRDYVCGLRLTWHGAPPVVLGYCNSKASQTLTVRSLAGFVVAVGNKGIHALRLVDEDGTRTRWAGRPHNTLITERLSRRRPVFALDADFDVSGCCLAQPLLSYRRSDDTDC